MRKVTARWVVSVFMAFLPFPAMNVQADPIKTCDEYSSKTLNKKADKFKREIARAARKYRVEPALIKSIITTESCFRPRAYSHKHAAGLMQLIPATAERFGALDVFDPAENIDAGTRYLRYLLKRYKGSLKHVIAAYNAGENRVERGQEEITVTFTETRRYVGKVLNAYTKFSEEKQEAKLLLAEWHAAEAAWQAGKAGIKQPRATLAVYRKGGSEPEIRQAVLKKEEKSGEIITASSSKVVAPVQLKTRWNGAVAHRIQVAGDRVLP